MSSQDISLTIKANDNASAELSRIRAELDRVNVASKNAGDGFNWLRDCNNKLLIQVAAATQVFSAAAAAFGKAVDWMNIGATALKAEEAFGAMAESVGVDAAKMTAAMKKSVSGFVDESHLMQKAAFAMASDIDPEKIPKLFESARMAARLTGKDVVESIDGIIQAVSTNMPKSLRQMGLITKEQMSILNQAAAAGITEVNLLDIVLANAAIKSAMLGDSQDNAAKQVKKFKVELEELKETIGKTLLIAVQKAFGAFQWLASGVLAATAAIPKFMEMVSRLSAFVNSKTGNKEMAAAALRDAAQMESIYNAMLGASGELAYKGAANMTGASGEKGRGADPAAAAKAKADLQRIMDDLKKRIAAAKDGDKLDKLREEWAKIERDLDADIAKSGLGEFEKKIIDIDKKVEELKIKAAKLPTEAERTSAGGKIESWASEMKGQLESEQYKKDLDAQLEAAAEGRKALEELDKSLTASRASELQKQLIQVDEAAKKESELAVKAKLNGVITEEEYAAKEIKITQSATDAKKKHQDNYNKTVREAEINQRIAALDLLEKEGLAHRKTIAERISLTRELIRAEEDHLATMDKGKDEAAWYAQSDKVNAARKSYAELTREMTMTDPFGALKLSMDDIINKWTDIGQQMYDIAQSTAQGMQQALSDFFFDAFTGKLKSLGDYVTSFCNSVSRAIANALSQQMTAGISSGANSLFGSLFGGGSTMSAGGTVAAQIASYGELAAGFHSGGMGKEPTFFRIVPNLDILPRYHRGLGPGERLSVTTDDEMTLTPGQQKAMWALAEASGGNSSQPAINENHLHVHMNINAVDSRSVLQAIQPIQQQIVGMVQQAYNKRGQRGPNG